MEHALPLEPDGTVSRATWKQYLRETGQLSDLARMEAAEAKRARKAAHHAAPYPVVANEQWTVRAGDVSNARYTLKEIA